MQDGKEEAFFICLFCKGGGFQHIEVEGKGPAERRYLPGEGPEGGGKKGIMNTCVRMRLGRERRNREISTYVTCDKDFVCSVVKFVSNSVGQVLLTFITGETG